jgi:outer membrane protein assembly factor BamB
MWSANAPLEPAAIAADSAGVVVVGTNGSVVALDPAGSDQWRMDLGTHLRESFATVSDELVVLSVDRSRFVALDRVTGAHRWTYDAPDARGSSIGTGPDGPIVATVTIGGSVAVLEGSTGVPRWDVDVSVADGAVAFRSFVSAERVLVAWADTAGSHVRAFVAGDGALAWSRDAPNFASMPVVDGDSVFFAENERRDQADRFVSRVRSLSVIDGTERWSSGLRSRWPFWAALATAASEEFVAVVDLNGRITVLDTTTGQERWHVPTRLRQYEGAAHIVNGVFAMPTYGTGLTVLSAGDGSAVEVDDVGEVQTGMTIAGTAAVGDRLYLLVGWSWGDAEVWMLQAGPA